jgi:Fe-S cluster assembly protein SufD
VSDVVDLLGSVAFAASAVSLEAKPESAMEAYRFDFEESAKLSKEPAWLRDIRREAMGTFERLDFPTMKDEDWHFTNVAPIAEKMFALPRKGGQVSEDLIARFAFGSEWNTIVFVNGRLERIDEQSKNIRGTTITTVHEEIAKDSELLKRHLSKLASPESAAFTALNTAFAVDGAVIRVAPDAVVEKPIHLLFISDENAENTAIQTRNLIFAERHSQCTIIESYVSVGGENYFANAVTEVFVGEGARIGHYKLQTESRSAFHVGTIQVEQARDSRYESFSFATGAKLSRTNVYTTLAGDAAEAILNGLYMVDGSQHVDHQTRIEHVAPNCPSHELYKGILDGNSHGVFNGKVYVHPEAQKTDGKQSNNNLLLSDGARVDTKPQLEIFADDVKCTHGATVGRLDETALFYMRSRGIGPSQAKRLLTYAFAADVLEKIELEPLKEALEAQVLDKFTS